MELAQVRLDDRRRIAIRVARHENGFQHVAALVVDNVNHFGHLVKLVGADVGAVREPKVDLRAHHQISRAS